MKELTNVELMEIEGGAEWGDITGGDYVELGWGLMYTLAVGAGAACSPFLLAGAVVVGGALLLYGET